MGGIMSMHRLTYRIKTLSPLVLSKTGSEGHLVTTRDFIPGTVIMGMCAARYIQEQEGITFRNAHEDKNFLNWFLQGSICFGNAYIASIEEEEKVKDNIPVPHSVQQMKDESGDVYDLLFHEPEKRSSALGGYGRIINLEDETSVIYIQPIKKSLNFHHQHDAAKGTVKQGIFFNYESIDAGQTFTGEITGSENHLRAFKDEVEKDKIFYVGRSRNTQYGKIKFEWVSGPRPIEIDSDQLDIYEDVSLTLLSDLILYNENGLSTTDPQVLENLLKRRIGNGGLNIKKAFIKNQEVENHVAVWKLRRPSENCFKAGSCFLVSGLTGDDGEKLAEMVKTGIGERRKEGFGKIAVNIQQDPELRLTKLEKDKKGPHIKAPKKIPGQAKNILTTLVKNLLSQHVELNAIMESKDFQKLPGKSLIGRLESILETVKEKSKDSVKTCSQEFKRTLGEDLRKTAADSLERCNNRKQTLLEFITGKSVKMEEILRSTEPSIKEINKLMTEKTGDMDLAAALRSEKDFEEELFFIYFHTFFTTMRRIKKISEEGER
jgi:CRISPR-associated protein Csx10